MKLYAPIVIILIFASALLQGKETVQLDAPDLMQSSMRDYEVRGIPVYKGFPQMKVQVHYRQGVPVVVIDNYGHGGAGFIYGPGSIDLSFQSMEKACRSIGKKINSRRDRVAVLGAGVNGLMIANQLAKRGYQVTVYADRFSPNTTSNEAPGVFVPAFVSEREDNEDVWDRMIAKSWEAYDALSNTRCPEYKGVQKVDLYTFDGDAGFDVLENAGLVEGKEVEVDFNNGQKKEGKRYNTFLIDNNLLMAELERKARMRGVKFVNRKVSVKSDIVKLGATIIFNCTGLGAESLFKKQGLVTVQGNLDNKEDEIPVDYMVFAKNEDGGYTYWIPNKGGLLLGAIYEVDPSDKNVSFKQMRDMILKNVKAFIGLAEVNEDEEGEELASAESVEFFEKA